MTGAISQTGGLRLWFSEDTKETLLYLRLVVDIFSVLKRYQEAEDKVGSVCYELTLDSLSN